MPEIAQSFPAGTVCHVARMVFPPSWRMAEHVHADRNELLAILSGAIETRIRGEHLTGMPGDVLLYPAGVPHAERAADPRGLEMLFVSYQPAKPHVEPATVRTTDRRGRIRTLVRWMLERFPPSSPGDQAVLDALLLVACHEWAARTDHGDQDLVQTVKAYVHEHLREPITLDDLAGAAHLSKFHFSRIFRRAVGTTPAAFVRSVRVEAAREMLLSSNLPLKAIAALVGFPDPFRFSKVFRSVTGLTPSALRPARAPARTRPSS